MTKENARGGESVQDQHPFSASTARALHHFPALFTRPRPVSSIRTSDSTGEFDTIWINLDQFGSLALIGHGRCRGCCGCRATVNSRSVALVLEMAEAITQGD